MWCFGEHVPLKLMIVSGFGESWYLIATFTLNSRSLGRQKHRDTSSTCGNETKRNWPLDMPVSSSKAIGILCLLLYVRVLSSSVQTPTPSSVSSYISIKIGALLNSLGDTRWKLWRSLARVLRRRQYSTAHSLHVLRHEHRGWNQGHTACRLFW